MQEAQLDVIAMEATKAHEEWLKAVRDLEVVRVKYSRTEKPGSETEINKRIREVLTVYNVSPSRPASLIVKDILIEHAKETAAWKEAQESLQSMEFWTEECAKKTREVFDRMVDLIRQG